VNDADRLLALIPARGGSKRLPRKNLLPLHGRPLIEWTIGAVKGIADVCDILVSTDDAEIARLAVQVGASVPWMRPPELASDSAGSVDVAIHALDRYEAEHGPVNGLLLLQPTSPFRTTSSIRKGIDLFKHGGGLPVLGVSPIRMNPAWTYLIDDGLLVPFADAPPSSLISLPQYIVNGAFYLVTGNHLREYKSFTGSRTIPLVFESEVESLDIDTALDFAVAEAIANGASQ